MILETQPGFVKQNNENVLRQSTNRLQSFVRKFDRRHLPKTTQAYVRQILATQGITVDYMAGQSTAAANMLAWVFDKVDKSEAVLRQIK